MLLPSDFDGALTLALVALAPAALAVFFPFNPWAVVEKARVFWWGASGVYGVSERFGCM